MRDVYQRFLRPDIRADKYVFVARFTVIFAGLAALYLATLPDEFFSVALFAYTIYGAGVTPVLLAAYFWPRATTKGAISSMLSGVGVAILWRWLTTTSTQDLLHGRGWEGLASLGQWAARAEVDAVIPAFLLSVIVLVAVSLAGPPPPEERAQAFQGHLGDAGAAPPKPAPAGDSTSST